jgi:hypothetical protein
VEATPDDEGIAECPTLFLLNTGRTRFGYDDFSHAAEETLNAPKAFSGWDAARAKRYSYPIYRVNQ